MEYVKSTWGEWCKTHKPEGRTLLNCEKCGWVLLPEGIKMNTLKECPNCKTTLPVYENKKRIRK